MNRRRSAWKRLNAGISMAFLATCVAWGGQASLAAAAPEEISVAAEAEVAEKANDAAEDNQKIVINLAARSLALVRNDKKVSLYPIGPGKPSTPTPVGYYKVTDMELNPTWIDPTDPEYAIPSGEQNPLGYRWILIYGNYGIHGTNNPDSVGHYVSNGCIRMLEKDVEDLYENVDVGTPIEITYNRIVVEKTADNTVVYYIYPDGYDRQDVTVSDVNNWLSGFGVENFEPDAEIEKKIELADGEPTYVAKAYTLFVNGKKIHGKVVVKGDITYLPVGDIAEAKQLAFDWKPESEEVSTQFGKAVAYSKKNVLYCNADDVAVLFRMDGGLNNNGVYELKDITAPIVQPQQPAPQQPVQPTQQPQPAVQQPIGTEDTSVKPSAAPQSADEAERMAQEEAAQQVRDAQAKEEAKRASREKNQAEVPTRSTRNNANTTTVITTRAVAVA